MSADKYAAFISEQQRKLSVSGTNPVEIDEKKHMSKAEIAALKEPKDKFDEKDLAALRNKEHLKKEETEDVEEGFWGDLGQGMMKSAKDAASATLNPIGYAYGKAKQVYKAYNDMSKAAGQPQDTYSKITNSPLGAVVNPLGHAYNQAKLATSKDLKQKNTAMQGALRKNFPDQGSKPKSTTTPKNPDLKNRDKLGEAMNFTAEEMQQIDEAIKNGKIKDMLDHHLSGMKVAKKMMSHHEKMADTCQDCGDENGWRYHIDHASIHLNNHDMHKSKYDGIAGLASKVQDHKDRKAAMDVIHKGNRP